MSNCLFVFRFSSVKAFIVRYDAERDRSLYLPEHSDTSLVSLTLALNSSSSFGTGFSGGGTWFRALQHGNKDPGNKTTDSSNDFSSLECDCNFHGSGVVDADSGQVVVFAGPLRHGGFPVSSGTRYILVVFMYAEEFPYHEYLQDPRLQECQEDVASGNSGGTSKYNRDRRLSQESHDGDYQRGMRDICEESLSFRRSYVVYRETLELMTTLNKLEEHTLS